MNEEDLSGKTIEGYHVIRPIGQGKFATVYKAETPDKKVVALKKIKIFEMNDPKLRDKCLKEVRLMQQLEHPNIIKYLDSFISNNELIIITEWAEKGDLKRLLKNAAQSESPLDENKIWELVYQIASALKHMHDKRIMHRDLKPANIFISSDDSLKVGDFGLGRVFSEETVEAYSKVGTPLYMSPELLIGQGYDMKSDVWSLGCIAYEMCEMKSPFRNENEKMSLMDLFNNITKGEFKPVSNKFSEDMRSIIQQMIIVDPQRRCDLQHVIDAYNQWKEKEKNVFKIDSLIIMEDIAEKLNLIDYRNHFCSVRKREPVSRTFFALSDGPSTTKIDKFLYFYELSYWLIDLLKTQPKGKLKPAKEIEILKDDSRNLAKKLLDDIKKLGITLNPPINPEHILSGIGDAVCFIVNELLNRQLITMNYKFEMPNYAKFDVNEENYTDGEIKELDEERIFKEDPNSIESDDEEKEDKGPLTNTTYYSNSTSATSTITDQMYRHSKKNLISDVLKDQFTIDENMMELDSIEWNKEVDRVSKVLEELNSKIQNVEQDPLVLPNMEDDTYNLEILKKSYKQLKDNIPKVRSHTFQKKIDQWNGSIINLQKGEKKINDACVHLTENLRDIVANKKNVYEKLTQHTDRMKEKISYFDELNKKLHNLNQMITEKEQDVLGNARKNQLSKTIERLKLEITELDVKREVLRSLWFNNIKKQNDQTSY